MMRLFAGDAEGRTVPGCEAFDFSFGGRRQFCKSNYADLGAFCIRLHSFCFSCCLHAFLFLISVLVVTSVCVNFGLLAQFNSNSF